MQYFTEDNYNAYYDEEEFYEVYFDDKSGKKINDRPCFVADKIWDEDGTVYVNLDEVSDNMSEYLSYALSGMDRIVKSELEDSGRLERYFYEFMDDIREDYKESVIYPFVNEEDFLSALSERMDEKGVEQQDMDSRSDWDDEDDYHDDEWN